MCFLKALGKGKKGFNYLLLLAVTKACAVDQMLWFKQVMWCVGVIGKVD